MQRCQKCHRTYQDDRQKFCTHDGGRLELVDVDDAPTVQDLNKTVLSSPSELNQPMIDLNKTVANPSPPPPTGEIRQGDTGPTQLPRYMQPTAPPGPAPTYNPAPEPQQPSAPQYPPPSPQYPPPQYPATSQPPAPAPPPSPRDLPTIAAVMPPESAPPHQQMPPPPSPTQAPPQSMPPPQTPPPPGQQQFAPPQAMPQQPMPQQQPMPHAATAPRKSSRTPLILGGVVVLLLLLVGVGAAMYFVVWPRMSSRNNTNEAAGNNANASSNTNASSNSNANSTANANANENSNANANLNANANTNTFTPPPNSFRFVNSAGSLDGKLAEDFVGFSFYYPQNWQKDPKAGVAGANNFVKVERNLGAEYPQERFVVSFYESNGGTVETDRINFAKQVENFNSSFSKSFSEYQKLSEGPTKVNSIDGYEFKFTAVGRNTPKGDITYWGRVIFLPPGVEGGKYGVTLLMLTSSLAPELKSADDVGVKGQLPVMLNSFRFGKE